MEEPIAPHARAAITAQKVGSVKNVQPGLMQTLLPRLASTAHLGHTRIQKG